MWSHTDPVVKTAVQRVDHAREVMVRDFFALTVPRSEAAMLAELFSTLVATSSRTARPTPADASS